MKKQKGSVMLPADMTLDNLMRAFKDQINLHFGFYIDNDGTVKNHRCCFIERIGNPRIIDPSLPLGLITVDIAFRTKVNEIDSIDPVRWSGVFNFQEKMGYPQSMENGWPKFFCKEPFFEVFETY